MYQCLMDRGDVDKEHVIELDSDKAKLFFLKENSGSNALKRVESMLLDFYEKKINKN